MDYREVSEIRDGMRIDWDMPITMDDGVVLRCDIYRPIAEGRYPVIMTYGPYGKWLHFVDLYADQFRRMCEDQPDVPTDSTNKYQCWEERPARRATSARPRASRRSRGRRLPSRR